MKKLSLFALAAAGLFLGACSSDKDEIAEVQPINVEEDGGKQFIALNINLPVDNGFATRSDVTDDNNYGDTPATFELNDGMESEYKVNDATLIVFRPAASGKEADATFVAAYQINPEPWTMSSDKQVTDYSTKIVQKVGTTVAEGDLALVILNKNNLIAFDATGALQVGAAAFTGTFGDFQKTIATNATGAQTAALEMTQNGFYMANSPLTDKAGSSTTEPTGAKTQTLVEIKNVYETEQEARDGECAEIYVERGMAKVTVNGTPAKATLDTQYNGGATPVDLNITIDGWVLDQTNQKSYYVRSTEGHDDFIPIINGKANKYRYIGISPIVEGNPTTYKYRTYWAKDPNYTKDLASPATFGDLIADELTKTTVNDAALSTEFGDTHPQYCYENTFDVAHQSVNNTTLVRLKVTAKVGSTADDLYIINGNKSMIYKEADVKTLIQNKALEFVKTKNLTLKTGETLTSADFTVTLSDRDVAGYKNISAITFTAAGKAKVIDADAAKIPADADILADVVKLYKNNTITGGVSANDGSILCYEGGVSYYTIRVKHFGDQLTPWKTWEGTTGYTNVVAPTLANGSYPGSIGNLTVGTAEATAATAANNYLGRYGMLRNNWYDIKVNKIKYLGEAVPTDYSKDPTPDDEIDGYIAVQINILSWAKRTQSWDL
jgi:hypothetical protein